MEPVPRVPVGGVVLILLVYVPRGVESNSSVVSFGIVGSCSKAGAVIVDSQAQFG